MTDTSMAAAVPAQPVDPGLGRVNLAHLEELRGIDDDLVPDLIDIFLDCAPGQLADIGAALDASDADRLGFCAHLFKGSCATVGADGLTALSLELEMQAKERSLEGGQARYRHLLAGLDAVLAVLATERH